MLKNYITIAIRNLRRNKAFSAINIFGLAIGMTCCMLLVLYISSELSFDKHHKNAKDIFLVNSLVSRGGEKNEFPRVTALYAAALKNEFPEIEASSRLFDNFIESKTLVKYDDPARGPVSFYETRGLHVDSTFFNIFTYQFVEGSAEQAMKDPSSLVITEEIATKLFGREPALNKTVVLGGLTGSDQPFKVSGVIRDEKHRSHIDGRFFVSMHAGFIGDFLRTNPLDFSNNNMFYTYIKLHPETDPQVFSAKLQGFMDKHAKKDLVAYGNDRKITLLPLTGLHLYNGSNHIVSPNNSMTYIYILSSIAIFILLIACINFMNLSTARSAKRAAEVGIRKVMGAGKGMLVRQFVGESVILSLLALALSLIMAALLLTNFNALTGREYALSQLFEVRMLLIFVILAIITGLLAGSYPAFYLSVFNPVHVLKGKFINSVSATSLRKGLVVFQFVISIGLVLASIVIIDQMRYMQSKPLGFNNEQQVVVPLRSQASHDAYTSLRNAFQQNSAVLGAEGTHYYPGIINPTDFTLYKPEKTVNDGRGVKTNRVSPDFLHMMGFELLQGRLFSKDFPADTASKLVVNEATLRALDIPLNKSVGQKLNFSWQGEVIPFEIIGVVKDFHFEALHKEIQPYAFLLSTNNYFNYIIVKTNAQNARQAITHLEQQWKKIRNDEPFEYSFLQEDFMRNYESDKRTASIVNAFTIISILISCLGLFGLAAFAAQQKTKEIGVRKVLGATVVNITTMLSADFIRLVMIAIVIASPIAWYFMNKWLEEFAYRTSIHWWVFLLTAVIALLIALFTVSFQAIRAALMNPVKSLRTE